jgi:diguanylate cyclase (GGDEF)-like protein
VLKGGQKLLDVGQLNSRVYFLIEGQLRLFDSATSTKAFGLVDMGQSAAMLSAVEQKPSPEAIIASEDCRVLVVELNTLVAMSSKSREVAHNFSVLLIKCLRGEHYLAYDGSAGTNVGRISYVDELTGLHNNRWLRRIMPRLIMRHSKDRKALSLIMCDIDKFKTFNEDFGESLENQALSTVAQLMMENARPTDMIVRYELDVFLLLLPDTDLTGARQLATRIQEVVSKKYITIPNECVLPPVTMSFGVTQLKGFVSDEVLMGEVKVALEEAKKHGGNWVEAIG